MKWLNNPYVIGILLAIGATTDLILVGLDSDLSKSDWATWVGSVGTVGTLLGTIYIARTESRKRERAELLTARLRGTELNLELAHAHNVIGRVASRLVHAEIIDPPPDLFVMCLQELGDTELWNTNDLILLAPLPGNASFKLAEAAAKLRMARRRLNQQAGAHHLITVVDRMEATEGIRNQLLRAEGLVREAMEACQAGARALSLTNELQVTPG
jgi:hypothetical protein